MPKPEQRLIGDPICNMKGTPLYTGLKRGLRHVKDHYLTTARLASNGQVVRVMGTAPFNEKRYRMPQSKPLKD